MVLVRTTIRNPFASPATRDFLGLYLNPVEHELNCPPRLVYRCRHCSWPLCSPHCQQEDGPHARECSLFQIHNPRFVIEDYKATCPSYNAIMVLRILWLRDNQPDTWKLIDMLMDHLDDDKELTKTKIGVIDFIRGHCKLTQFSEKEILHVMGVIDTNAYIIGENATKDVDLQGLFPITSILNHSCAANTICFARDDFTFSCRAVTDVKKGEELTTNYLHYHYHFFGLSYRRPELKAFWHFDCSCRRCNISSSIKTEVTLTGVETAPSLGQCRTLWCAPSATKVV